MAVLIEANSVIVRMQAVHDRHAGGWQGFDDSVPNNTLCSDGEVARVGFMDPNDSEAFIAGLERQGLVFLRNGQCQDIAFAVQNSGLTVSCDWLDYYRSDLNPGETVEAVRLKGTTIGKIFCPAGWAYEKSLSRQFAVVPPEHVDKSLKFLRHQDGLDIYLDILTGKEVYIGRTGA